jgi:hypothetical protein
MHDPYTRWHLKNWHKRALGSPPVPLY